MRGDLAVVDASAVAALLFGEPRAGDIARRLDGLRLVAPTLLRYEIASVCLKKVRLHPESEPVLLQALQLVDDLDLREVAVPHREVVALARRAGLTVYDASYLWVAQNLGVVLITLDDRLRRAAKGRGRRRS